MTYLKKNLVRPELTLKLEGLAPLTLVGTFENLKKVQHEMGEDIIQVAGNILTAVSTDLCKIVSVLSDSDLQEIEEAVFNTYGFVLDDLRCMLFELLKVSIVPEKKRKDAQKETLELLTRLKNLQKEINELSLGKSTENSA